MIKTFNRQPVSVNTPSNSDIKDYFFTHSNWKGLNDNKNILTVDQETFSDCKNVYVNSDGLLKSRPSLTKTDIVVVLETGESVLANIIDFWEFSNVKIYKTTYNNHYYLTFVNSNFDSSLQVSTEDNIKLVLAENNVFVFSKTSLSRYDIENHKYLDATDFVYIPIHKVKNVGSLEETVNESINELTNIYITRYLFKSASDIDFSELVGKYISVNVDGNNYQIKFVEGMQVTWVQGLTALKDDNFLSINGVKYPLISVADNKHFILTSIQDNIYKIYYTTDGKEFTELPSIAGAIGIPELSKDGKIVALFRNDDVYCCRTPLSENGVSDEWVPFFSNHDNANLYQKYLEYGLYFDNKCALKILSEDVLAATGKINGYASECLISLHYSGSLKINDIYGERLSTTYETIYDGVRPGGSGALKVIDLGSKIMSRSSLDSTAKYIEIRITSHIIAYSGTVDGNYTYRSSIKYTVNYSLGNIKTTFDKDLITDIVGNTTNHFTKHVKLEFAEIVYTFKGADTPGNELIVQWYSVGYVNYNKYIPTLGNYNLAIVNDVSGMYVALDCGTLHYIDNSTHKKITDHGISIGTRVDRNCKDYPLKIYKNTDSVDVSHFILKKLENTSVLRLFKDVWNIKTSETTSNSSQYDDVPYSNFKDFRAVIYDTVYASDCILTDKFYYKDKKRLDLLFPCIPVYCTDSFLYLATDNKLYTNTSELITIDYVNNKTGQTDIDYNFNKIVNDNSICYTAEMSDFYFANGKNVYISSKPVEGDFKWYLPEINTTVMNEEVTNLHPISDTEMAVFTEKSVSYMKKAEDKYYYYKSKLQVGCKSGSDILTTYDGIYTIFASNRGLVAMQYQNFVATTEQSLTYISDTIHDTFNSFNDSSVKLFKYEYWIYCYKIGSNKLLLFDVRNNSWWPVEFAFPVNKIVLDDNNVKVLSNNKMLVMEYSDNYYDFDGEYKYPIDWYIQSQRLHLNSINYSKHISSITLTTVSESDKKVCINLNTATYKKYMQLYKKQSFNFDIDLVRTYVKKLNYSKVNEFQYVLSCNKECAIQVPLSLSNIMIKYKISGQVK